jgi:hypothetical protein
MFCWCASLPDFYPLCAAAALKAATELHHPHDRNGKVRWMLAGRLPCSNALLLDDLLLVLSCLSGGSKWGQQLQNRTVFFVGSRGKACLLSKLVLAD